MSRSHSDCRALGGGLSRLLVGAIAIACVLPRAASASALDFTRSGGARAVDGGAFTTPYTPAIDPSRPEADGEVLHVEVWRAFYDDTPNLTAGSLQSLTTGATIDEASDFLPAQFYAPVLGGTSATASLDGEKGQDQIATQVPEPVSLLLFGLAALLAGCTFRRRARARPVLSSTEERYKNPS